MTILSFTGVDDATDINALVRELTEYRMVGGSIQFDLGVIFFPEKQGMARNPGYLRRLEIRNQFYSTVHLCGRDIFCSILHRDSLVSGKHMEELKQYPCIQVNINARGKVFDTSNVHEVYSSLLKECPESNLVLQFHPASEYDIISYLDKIEEQCDEKTIGRIQILLDESLGRGKTRNSWGVPNRLKNYNIRIAGGINAGNIDDIYKQYTDANKKSPYVIDMESGIRTNDQFDIEKVMRVINTKSLEFIYL
jgi:hypothetical protein